MTSKQFEDDMDRLLRDRVAKSVSDVLGTMKSGGMDYPTAVASVIYELNRIAIVLYLTTGGGRSPYLEGVAETFNLVVEHQGDEIRKFLQKEYHH